MSDFFTLLIAYMKGHAKEPFKTGNMRNGYFTGDGGAVFWEDVEEVYEFHISRDRQFIMGYEDRFGVKRHALGEWQEEMIE